mgnify:CR=1 FL=1
MNEDREEVYSKAVKAGKRTYFFDVKATRNNDYYLTITESKKKFDKDGVSSYEKHKIFLYKEDFEKFVMQNRKKYDAFNLSAAFTGRVFEFLQGSMTKMILHIKLLLTMLMRPNIVKNH